MLGCYRRKAAILAGQTAGRLTEKIETANGRLGEPSLP